MIARSIIPGLKEVDSGIYRCTVFIIHIIGLAITPVPEINHKALCCLIVSDLLLYNIQKMY